MSSTIMLDQKLRFRATEFKFKLQKKKKESDSKVYSHTESIYKSCNFVDRLNDIPEMQLIFFGKKLKALKMRLSESQKEIGHCLC